MKPKILSDIDDINNRISNDEANYNANDVLSKIEIVDGSGSGLDADLLDNKDSTFLVPTGAVHAFAGGIIPIGWLECNGSIISRNTYNNLFSVIGTTYGAGDGSTTFKLPDLRGYFVRGYDHGAGVDSGRELGSTQQDSLKSHTHTQIGGVGSSGSGWTWAGNGSTNAGTTGSTGGAETRPKNIALMYIIKF
ncbi:MAG: Tail Collar domain protein [Clostridiaceae bacterium]|nr:Tail Collar domain protein [Clostridiaceae bacterium]